MTVDLLRGHRDGSADAPLGSGAQRPRFRSVLLATLLAGIIAMGSAYTAADAGSDGSLAAGFVEDGVSVSVFTTYAAMTLEEMAEEADLVAFGEVLGSSAPYPSTFLPSDGLEYYRDIYVRVSQVPKGSVAPCPFDRGLVVERASEANLLFGGSGGGAVVAVRAKVDSHNGVEASDGVGEIAEGAEALLFLGRDLGIYRLQRGNLDIYYLEGDGVYFNDYGMPVLTGM